MLERLRIAVFFGLVLGCLPGLASSSKENPGTQFKELLENLREQESKMVRRELTSHGQVYPLQIFSKKISKIIREDYKKEQLEELASDLKSVTDILVRKDGIVQAADRPLNQHDDPTHYDAIWLRDSLWVYLGLQVQADKKSEAKKVLLKMWDYLSSSDQLHRFTEAIKKPIIVTNKNGAMNAVHIRFDGKSPSYKDITVDGKPQTWNHKQNDALGLFLDLALRSLDQKEILENEVSDDHLLVLIYLPVYFAKIKYWDFEDAGSWEEIERNNSSSIGLVTSGLEKLSKMMGARKEFPGLFARLDKLAKEKKLASFWGRKQIDQSVGKGYARIFKQLKAGGESPLYAKNDKRFRKADIALLNLIYPANLAGITLKDKTSILEMVQPLIGEVGIKRYLLDSYQCGNFWFTAAETSGDKTDDTSSAEDFIARGKQFIADSEAQWFFDSWYSKVVGILYRETKEQKYLGQQIKFLNRALAQITSSDRLGADGRKVGSMSLPESYNVIVSGKERFYSPSPITPLNWAKASMALAIDDLKTNL